MQDRIPRVPTVLKSAGRRFWRRVLADFVLVDEHHLRLLEQAASCLDRIEEAASTLEKEGSFVEDRFEQIREHPACKVERDNKTLFYRIIRELGLDITTTEDSRSPRQY